MEIGTVIQVVSALCLTGGGICAVAALVVYAMSHFGQAEGMAEGRLMGLVLGAMAFFAAAALVNLVNVSFPGS